MAQRVFMVALALAILMTPVVMAAPASVAILVALMVAPVASVI